MQYSTDLSEAIIIQLLLPVALHYSDVTVNKYSPEKNILQSLFNGNKYSPITHLLVNNYSLKEISTLKLNSLEFGIFTFKAFLGNMYSLVLPL